MVYNININYFSKYLFSFNLLYYTYVHLMISCQPAIPLKTMLYVEYRYGTTDNSYDVKTENYIL